MKKMILAATILAVSLSGALTAQADHSNGIGGLIIGAGGGAIAGQAIGRNTEATLIGTAVGSLLGYVIGNEIDKGSTYRQPVHHQQVYQQPVHHQQVYRQPVYQQPIYHQAPPPVIYREQRVVKQRPVIQHNYYYQGERHRRIAAPPPQCREAEILGTVNGRAKKIYGTVCRTANGWELVSEPTGPAGLSNKRHKQSRQHWVDRRF